MSEPNYTKVTTIWTNAYAVRNELRGFGATWDASRKAWILPPVAKREVVPVSRLWSKPGVEVAVAE